MFVQQASIGTAALFTIGHRLSEVPAILVGSGVLAAAGTFRRRLLGEWTSGKEIAKLVAHQALAVHPAVMHGKRLSLSRGDMFITTGGVGPAKPQKDREEGFVIVKQTYRLLLTRGVNGCYVFLSRLKIEPAGAVPAVSSRLAPNWRLNSFCFQRVSILGRTSMLAEDDTTSRTET